MEIDMGKRSQTSDETFENGENETSAKEGTRAIYVTDPETGENIKRNDFIRKRADAGTPRGQIAKELSELQGKTIPYQIVFAATKNHPNYAKRANDTEATEAAA
jgi:hypothetical protein